MVRRKEELEIMNLAFATIPNGKTNEVKLIISPGKIWHIIRRKDGIYLVDRNRQRGQRDAHKLSEYAEDEIPTDAGFKIDYRGNMFVVQYTRGHFEYSRAEHPYVQISNARSFMELGEHKFRCSSLEFKLEMLRTKKPEQKMLFN